MRVPFDRLQPLGRSLMLPIAVLPVASLLLRLGQPDLLDISFIAAAGSAIFSNLGLLFAIGVAVGIARENHGAAGLAGAVCFLVVVEGAKDLVLVPPEAVAAFGDAAARDLAAAAYKAREMAKLSVPAGIFSGLVSGWLYNRYATISLPEYLAFFGGRRFVPIAAGFAGVAGAAAFGLGFPWLEAGMDTLSRSVVDAGAFGLFAYGLLNRLLIITGLHHIINNIAWFIVGDYGGVTGDLNRFFAGDPAAGGFMAGFFPVMMFGLPAACLAMYRHALPERRKATGGMLGSLALTSFLTGVTEPIEFGFMFLAPVLYAIHAVLTGVSMAVMDLLGVRLGFGFSAGLLDYVLNFGISSRPLLLLPVGAVYFAVYYAAFSFCIRRFDLKTPGREPQPEAVRPPSARTRGEAFVAALGGAANLRSVDACTTRLRLAVVDQARVDEGELKALGARGTLRPGGDALQVVLGPVADQVASEIRASLRAPAAPSTASPLDLPGLVAALGGASNLRGSEHRSTRVVVTVADPQALNDSALAALGVRGVARTHGGHVHLILGEGAGEVHAALAKACAV